MFVWTAKKLWGSIFLFLLLLPFSSFASHIVGGSISYRCLGNHDYEITVRVYRDCFYGASNAQFDDPASVGIFAGINTNTLITHLSIPFIEDDTIEAVLDDCFFVPSDVCVHTTTYRDTVTLAHSAVGYQIVYQRCCRNQTINNIIEPDMTGASYKIDLTSEALEECNSSPVFNDYPPIFICVGRPIEFDHSATDANGDSLAYKLCTPLSGATFTNPQPQPPNFPPYDPVVWQQGFSLDNLLGGTGAPLAIDSNTGLLTGEPTIQGQYVVGVCVEEYRNGELLSVTRRDFQYNVGMCEQVNALIDAPDAQCENLTVEFTGENSEHTDSYEWYFDYLNDPSITSTEANPSYTYPDTGTYTVMLIADPGRPCVDTTFHDIFLQLNSLTADFLIETFDCLDSSVVALIDLSFDPISMPIAWEWEIIFNQDTIYSTEQNPVISLPINVSGTATLTATSQNGCIQTVTQNFTTGGDSPGDNIPDTVMVCAGNGVMLNPEVDTSTSYNYLWSPAEGLDDPNSPNPIATVDANTIYAVSVSPINNVCSFTKEVNVIVFEPPVLDYSTESSCDGLRVTFSNQSQNTDSFSWTIGDLIFNNENPTVTFDSAGFYDIILVGDIRELCPDTLRQTIEVREKTLQAAIEVELSNCTPDSVTVNFLDASINSEDNTVAWEWTFNNGETSNLQTPSLMLTNDQEIIATLRITTEEGCTDTVQDTFDIQLVDLNLPDTVMVCIGRGIALNPNPNLDFTYEWSPAEGLDDPNSPNPTATVTENATYTATINAINNACNFVETVDVILVGVAEAAFTADSSSCDGLTVFFNNQSINTDTYEWIIGDTSHISTAVHPSFTFDSAGTYPVTLIAHFNNVCPDTLTQSIEVSNKTLEAAIGMDINDCTTASLAVTFTDASINSENNTIAWDWNFSNGTTSDVQNPSLIFTETQEIIATLKITTAEGCTDSTQASFSIEVMELNIADSITVCLGESAPLNPGGNSNYTYQWTPDTGLDDPTAANPIVSPLETTTYAVTVTNISGDTCQIETDITVVVPPSFDLMVASNNVMTCESTTTLSGSSTSTVTYAWTNEAGDTISTNPEVVVTVSGQTTYTLTATSDSGCSMQEVVTVRGGSVDVEIEGGNVQAFCQGDDIVLNVNNLDPNDTLSYMWSPDSLIVSGEDTPNPVLLDTPGEHTITLTAENQFGCSTTEDITVAVVDTTMQLSFEAELDCTGTSVQFTNTSTNAFNYVWNFGDPNNPNGTSTETNPNYTYSEPGTYTVYLTIGYDVACTDTFFMDITTIDPQLIADFTFNYDECTSGSVSIQFSDQSINTFENPLTWDWSFENNGISTLQNPVLVLTDTQTLEVTLIITSENGCQDTTSQTISVEPPQIANLADTLIICPDMTGVNLNPNGNPGDTYVWTPATGLDDPTTANPFASPTETTTYSVIINSIAGTDTCMITDSVVVIVSPPLTVDAGPAMLTTCGEDVVLVATGSGSSSYVWTDESGAVISNEASVTVNPDNIGTYIVTASNDLACSARDTVQVINNEVNINTSNNGEPIESCQNEEISIIAMNLDDNDTLTYMWTTEGPGMILSEADSDTVIVIGDPDEPTTFTLVAFNQFECADTIEVVVNTTPFMIDFIPEALTACYGTPTVVSPGANPNFTYEWSPTDCVDDPNSPNPMVNVTEDKMLSVTITDPATSCTAERTVAVTATPPINLAAAKDTVLCEITNINLFASSSSPVTYSWTENGSEFSTDSVVTVMPPSGGTTYVVTATDVFGCTQEASINVSTLPVNGNLAEAFTNCVGDGVTLEVTDLDSDDLLFSWIPEDIIIDGQGTAAINVDPSENVEVNVEITNASSGCSTTLSTQVTAVDLSTEVTATARPDSITLGTSTVLDAGENHPDHTYSWEPSSSIAAPNSPNTQASPTEDTEYTVTVNNGVCSASSSVFVRVVTPICEFPNIFLPNAFTPNDDGENDELLLFGNFVDEMELIIYNRWGQKVFESRSQEEGWDGTFNGKNLQPDVYGYYLRVLCINGDELIEKGNVSLLK